MALPPVGVTLTADNSAGFEKALQSATAAVDNFTKSLTSSAAPAVQSVDKQLQTTVQTINGFGNVLKSAQGVLGGFGSAADGIVNAMGAVFDRVFTSVIRVAVRDAIRAIQDFITSTAQAAIKGTELETDLGRLGASFDAVAKVSFAPLVNQLSSLVEKAAPGFLGIVQTAESYLGGLGSDALVWGENLVNQFAQGIWNAIGSVLDALTGIANAVTYWLSPGSPPRLLPDIDKWGTAAANEFFGGWAKADFSVFSDLSGTLTNLIRSIPLPKADQAGVIPNILGAREGIAAAVDELRTTGTIASATIDKITTAVGTSDASVRGYLESMVKLQAANAGVKDAQDALNAVTKTYDDLLKPVDAQIAGITEAQQELADEQKKSLLALVLADPNVTANDKKAAQLEIDRIDAEQHRRLLVADQKTAVDGAQAKLDAAKLVQSQAQDEFDSRKAQLQLLTDQNNLLKQQLQLLESLNKAGGAEPKPKGGGAAVPKPFAIDLPDLSKLIPPDILKKWDEFTTALAKAWEKVQQAFQPTIDAIQKQLIPAFANLKKAVDDSMPAIESQVGRVLAFMVTELAIVGPVVVANMARILNDMADIWRNHHDVIINIIGLTFSAAFAIVTIGFNLIIADVAVGFNTLATIFDVGSLVLQGKWGQAWARILEGNRQFWDIITGLVRSSLELVLGIFHINLDALLAAIGATLKLMADSFTVGMGVVVNTIAPVIGAINAIIGAAQSLWNFLTGHIFSFHIELPDLPPWAIPGSPTPFEMGLRGISDALQGVSNDMYSLRAAATSMGTVAPVITSSTYNNTTHFVYSPTYGSAPGPVSDNFATMAALWG